MFSVAVLMEGDGEAMGVLRGSEWKRLDLSQFLAMELPESPIFNVVIEHFKLRKPLKAGSSPHYI
jgi:hypothetical protein